MEYEKLYGSLRLRANPQQRKFKVDSKEGTCWWEDVGPALTVADLIAVLREFPPDALVVCRRCSDYIYQEPPTLFYGIENSGGWIEEFHPDQWKGEIPPEVKSYCNFHGN